MHFSFPLEEILFLKTVPKIFCPRCSWEILCHPSYSTKALYSASGHFCFIGNANCGTPGNLALFSPEGGDNERRGENHLMLQKKSMLLTDGLKTTGNSFLAIVDKNEEKEMGRRSL